MRRFTTALAAAALLAGATALATPAEAQTARHFASCTAMHKVYPHGVGKPGAKDHTSGTPVTTFKRSLPLYDANTASDRDTDGIACEAG
jgi:Spy/CpxP family protein refolding chaperone